MQSQVSEISPVIRQVKVTVEGERLVKELDKAYLRLGQTARIKGFRQGKIPRQVLERYYRKDVEGDVLNRVITDSYRQAIISNNLAPVANPDIQAGEFIAGQDFQFIAKVEVRPAITLATYKGLTAKRTQRVVSDAQVDKEIEDLRVRVSSLQPVTDRDTVQKGDLCTTNFHGTVDGNPFVGGTGQAYVIEVGAGRFVPGVEAGLEGKKVGVAFELDADLPADFRNKDVAGKTAHWTITVSEVKVRQMPALDDEFAKDVGDYENLADLKKKLRERAENAAKGETEREVSESIMAALIDKNPFEVPPSMVERQIDYSLYQLLGRLPPEQVKRMKLDPVRLREDARDRSVRQVRGALLLDAVANAEKIDITDEHVEEQFQKLADSSGQPLERVRAAYTGERRDELRARLRNDKALDFLVKHAQIEDVSA